MELQNKKPSQPTVQETKQEALEEDLEDPAYTTPEGAKTSAEMFDPAPASPAPKRRRAGKRLRKAGGE